MAADFGLTLDELKAPLQHGVHERQGRIPVEFYHDEELGTWHFHVDQFRISGGGQATLDGARQAAAEAIAFALEGAEPREARRPGRVRRRGGRQTPRR